MAVRTRLEDEPDEPDEPEEPAPDGAAARTSLVPTVGMPNRDWEYSTKVLSLAEVNDGTALVKALTTAGADGWDLAEIVDGGDKRVLLLRRPKRSGRETRRVGFSPPTAS